MNDTEPWVFLPRRDPLADKPPETAWDVVRLWEVRRLRCNLIIGALFAIGLVITIGLPVILLAVDDFVSGLQLAVNAGLACLYFLLMMNLCFTVGWASELLIRAVVSRRVDRYGPIAFKVIMALSVVAVPVLIIWFLLATLSAIFN